MYKGYSSTGGTEDLQNIIYAIYTLFGMLMVVVMGLGAPTCYKWIVKKADNERNQWYSFFWAASIVATLCNGAILGFEIKFFFDTVSYNNLNPFKLVFVVFFCLLDMTIAKYITERYEENIETQQPYDQSLESTNPAQEVSTTPQETPTTRQEVSTTPQEVPTTRQEVSTTPQEVPTTPQETTTTPQEVPTTPQEVPTTPQEVPTTPQEASNTTPFQLHVPKAAVILSICFCCTIFCSKRNQQVHIRTLALWSLMFFVHLLSLAILPTFIWAAVLPVRVISLLASTCAAFFCLMAFVALLISIPTQLQSNKKSVYHVLLLLTVPALSSAIVVLGTTIYLRLIITSIDTTSVAGVILSFLPSAALTIIGWVASGCGGGGGGGGVRAEGGDATHRMEEGLTSSHDVTPHIHTQRRGGWANFIVRHLPWRRISHHPTSHWLHRMS